MTIWDGGTQLYEKALDVRSAIHETVASNLANEETPGYKMRQLPFRETLAALQRGEPLPGTTRMHPRHIPLVSSQHQIFQHSNVVNTGGGLDGNTVNLEQEMTRMAENTMMYTAVSQFLKGRFAGWSAAIAEGKG
ncbi:MAG: flagellar basal body rod protein FlgB [Nitrospirales bacterium]